MNTATTEELGRKMAELLANEVREIHQGNRCDWLKGAVIDAGEHRVGLEFAILSMFVTSQALRDGFANQEKASEILDHFHVASRRCLAEGNLIDEDVDFAGIVRERYEEYYQASQGRCEPLMKLAELFFVHLGAVDAAMDAANWAAHYIYLSHTYLADLKLAKHVEPHVSQTPGNSCCHESSTISGLPL